MNGIVVLADAVLVSVTNKSSLLRIAIGEDGTATEITKLVENVVVDDFAADEAGNLYLTTHPYDTLVLLSADGTTRVTIAGSTRAWLARPPAPSAPPTATARACT